MYLDDGVVEAESVRVFRPAAVGGTRMALFKT
jgi:hypothetical protein